MKQQINKLRTFRPSKTWIIFGVALAIGLLAALTARSYLSTQMEAIEARGKGKTINVLVAKIDVPKGALLSKDNVAIRPIPIEFAHSVALTPDDFERVAGQPLAYAVKSGEMLMWGLMETQRMPTFSARVEAGRRAMTVPVDEINSISGMLEPGDIIDLMVTMERNGRKITFPLLQSVQVMATGQRSVDDAENGSKQYSTVTLDTNPQEAQNIIVAREAGKLTALLRNPQDKEPIGKGGYDVAALLGQNGTPASSATPAPRKGVPVMYGGSGANIPPEALRLPKFGAAPNAGANAGPSADAGFEHAAPPGAPADGARAPVLSAVIR
ncbi:MAG TPA: Flp pilus assembly protein CpaB [Telluria sp.]|jgi:pilus assembly protein CpaB